MQLSLENITIINNYLRNYNLPNKEMNWMISQYKSNIYGFKFPYLFFITLFNYLIMLNIIKKNPQDAMLIKDNFYIDLLRYLNILTNGNIMTIAITSGHEDDFYTELPLNVVLDIEFYKEIENKEIPDSILFFLLPLNQSNLLNMVNIHCENIIQEVTFQDGTSHTRYRILNQNNLNFYGLLKIFSITLINKKSSNNEMLEGLSEIIINESLDEIKSKDSNIETYSLSYLVDNSFKKGDNLSLKAINESSITKESRNPISRVLISLSKGKIKTQKENTYTPDLRSNEDVSLTNKRNIDWIDIIVYLLWISMLLIIIGAIFIMCFNLLKYGHFTIYEYIKDLECYLLNDNMVVLVSNFTWYPDKHNINIKDLSSINNNLYNEIPINN